MVRWSRLVLVLLACFGAPSAACADDQVTIDRVFSSWAKPKGLVTIRHMAYCVVDRHPHAAQTIVREMGADSDLQARSGQLIDSKCVKQYFFRVSATRISSPVYLPLLAEALLLRDYGGQLPDVAHVKQQDHPALPEVELDGVHPRYREAFLVDRTLHRLNLVADCGARTAPDNVFNLARTSPDSIDENKALGALEHSISACGGNDLTYKFPTFVWRGALVINLYRLVDAARPVAHPEVNSGA